MAAGNLVEHALVLGSNYRPARSLRLGVRRIGECFDINACATAMRTRDASGGRYLNGALRIRSNAGLDALRDVLHGIEDEAGRIRGVAEVALDIDIVASRDGAGAIHVHKLEDWRRHYVRLLLTRIGFVGFE